MSECFIGIGKFSKYYFYILGTSLLKLLKNFLFGFSSINPESRKGLFGFMPELSKHPLVQSLYQYISYIIGGILFNYIISRNLMSENINKNNNKKNSLIFKYIIHNKQYQGSENISIFGIFIVCFFYFLHQTALNAMYLFNFDGLDIWTFDIIFILLFMDTYFIINLYKHKKYSIMFILITCTPLLVFSSFLSYTNHDDTEEQSIRDNNTYKIIEIMTGSIFYFIAIFIIFIFLSCIISYARVKTKVLIDIYYISPYKIIFYIGLFGFILTLIILILTTIFSCKGNEKIIPNYCLIKKDDNSKEYYYDNINFYFNDIKNNLSTIEFILEISLVTPIFLIVNFFEMTCEILTIMYLNPTYLLIRDNLYYAFAKIIFILFFINKNFEHYITLKQFLILETSEILALIGYSVYLEMVELRFCELENDLKKNIIERGDRETEIGEKSLDQEREIDTSETENEENENNIEISLVNENNEKNNI